MSGRKVIDESFTISRKRGNGLLKIRFVSFEDIETRFEQDWLAIGGKK